jgi:cation diffusion facilitator family transporter
MIALLIAYESLIRLARPVPIAYAQAISIAVAGLAVSLICAWLLREEHAHHHDEGEDHAQGHHHRDHNLRAAYLHVLADALTSVMAIGGLIVALWFGWPWIDAVVGLVGACVIASWSYGLIRDAGKVLLDVVPDGRTQGFIRERLEVDGDRVSDLHFWRSALGTELPASATSLSRSSPACRRSGAARRNQKAKERRAAAHASGALTGRGGLDYGPHRLGQGFASRRPISFTVASGASHEDQEFAQGLAQAPS